jgi:hypothetical protein
MIIDGNIGPQDYTFGYEADRHSITIYPNNVAPQHLGPHYCPLKWLEEHAQDDLVYVKALEWYSQNVLASYGPTRTLTVWEHLLEA